MPTTTVRNIDLMLVGSLGKEQLSNDGMQNLSLGLSGVAIIALSNADYTLTTDNQGEAMTLGHRLTGTLTASVAVIVPNEGRVFVVDNRTTGSFTVTYKTATGGGVAVTQGARSWVYCDGADVFLVGGGWGGGGGDSLQGFWRWLTSTTADPATGQLGVNNATYASATELRLAHLSDGGTDFANALATMVAQDEVYVQDQNDASITLRYALTGPAVSQGTWSILPVSWEVGQGTLTTNAVLLVRLIRNYVPEPAAPLDAAYLVSALHSELPNERVVTDTPTITWDHATAGQSKAQIPDGAVTYAKLQDVTATPRLLGRYGAGSGDAQEVSLGVGLVLDAGGVLSAAGAAPGGSSGQVQYNNGGVFAGSSGLTLTATQVASIDLATPLVLSDGGTGASTAAAARSNLGLAIGTNVQAFDATLTALAALTTGANQLPYFTGTDTATQTPLTAFARSLLDDADAASARTTLEIVAASETVAGVVELATSAEVTTGTDATRAVTPAGLAAKVPSGTAFSVPRYAAGGTALEASPITVDAAGAVIATATNIQPVWTWQAEHTTTTGGMFLEAYQPGTGSPSFGFRKAKGTIAAPVRETSALGGSGNLYGQLYARDAANTADAWVMLAQIQFMIESLDAQGRAGGFITFSTAPGVSAPQAEVARLTGLGGNLLLGLTSHGTGLTKGLALGSGTAPTTSPADAVQLWAADRAGLAGKGSLYLRSEDGTVHVLGDWVGLGTTTPRSILDVNGWASINKLGLNGVEASSAVPLTFGTGLTHKMYLYENALQRYGLGIATSTMQLFAPDPGGRIDLGGLLTADGTTFTGHLRITSAGNVGIGTHTFGTSAYRVLALVNGTAPTTSPVDAIQLWSADTGGVAGTAGLHLRTEDGTSHVFGTKVCLGTLTPETLAQHTITAPSGTIPLIVASVTTAIAGRGPVIYLMRRTSTDMLDGFGAALSFYLADDAGVDNHVGMLVVKRQGADNSGRVMLLSANAGVLASNSAPGDFAVDPVGNASLNLDVLPNGGQRVFALGTGVAPTTSPADGVQMWVEDVEGLAGNAVLHLRSEVGYITKIGNGIQTRRALTVSATATTTAPYVITSDESNKTFLPTNAAMAQFNLPAASAGLSYTFTGYTSGGQRIRAAAGDSIRHNGAQSAAAGAIESTTLYASVTLTAVNAIYWHVISFTGTWTLIE